MKQIVSIVLVLVLFGTFGWAKDYTKKPEVRRFIDRMANHYHFDRHYLNTLFSNIKFQKRALAIYVPKYRKKYKHITKKHRKTGSWDRYEKNILKPAKVDAGISFMHRYRKALHRAYRKYGVAPEYITAIIGIESHYGKHTGRYPVLDALATLAFEPNRRQKFYRSELKEFLLMTKREKINPRHVKGSYAGAIGLGQFMPSNYKTFVVDFNHDGKKRMQHPEDAIGSVAYYFRRHGWKRGQPVAVRVSYPGKRFTALKTGYKHKYYRQSLKHIAPKWEFNYRDKVHLIKLKRYQFDELWYGTHNFYVITRYNHSSYYAMAIYQLAEKLKKGYKKKYGKYLR